MTTTKLKTPVKTDDGTITEAVSEITWTGAKIQAGQYEDFNVAFGQLPDDANQLTLKALQPYSDGKVVRWIEATQSGGEEPENPAPVLKLTAKGAEEGGAATASPTAVKSAGAAVSDGSDSTARGLGVAGLVVGFWGWAPRCSRS